MRKTCFILMLTLVIAVLCGCSGDTKASEPKAVEESPEMVMEIAKKIEEVNTINHPREIDDFTVENEMGLKLEDLQAYAGNVTNIQSDCSLVFVVLCKDGKVNTIKDGLEAYRKSMTSNLYLEFAAKVKQAENARIVTSGNYVIMAIAGVEGPDYSAVDKVISDALGA